MTVLVGLAARSIQGYVFGSNRLVDVIGASAVIDELFDESKLLGDFDANSTRLLVSGAGRSILAVNDAATARRGVERFSRRRLTDAPGLEVTAVVYDRTGSDMASDLATLAAALADPALAPPGDAQRSIPPGVARCSATGSPASRMDSDPDPDRDQRVPLSAQAAEARQRGRAQADWRGRPLPPEFGNVHYHLPTQLDELGRTVDERSLIGVVHLDGNGIGKAVQCWSAKVRDGDATDEQIIGQYRDWSAGLRHRVDDAWEEVEHIVTSPGSLDVSDSGDQAWLRGKIDQIDDFELTVKKPSSGRSYPVVALPIRRIVSSGDDLTFICDGRIALSLAVAAARAYAGDVPWLGPVEASVGVALVHSHSPFIRAYHLADQLCRNAKTAHEGKAAIDWHLGLLEPGQNLGDVRAEQVERGWTCRPYRIERQDGSITWPDLEEDILGTGPTGLRGPHWTSVGAKARQLPALVRQRRSGVDDALKAWSIADPDLALPPPLGPGGYYNKRSPLIDAVELITRHQIPAGLPAVQASAPSDDDGADGDGGTR